MFGRMADMAELSGDDEDDDEERDCRCRDDDSDAVRGGANAAATLPPSLLR
jgi:hypothetical protein